MAVSTAPESGPGVRPTAALLVNLGTPDSPAVPDVRRYLAEFLSDPRVLDMNPIARALLLHGVILRTRPRRSAAAYAKVWTPEGSPLLVESTRLRDAVATELGLVPENGFRVRVTGDAALSAEELEVVRDQAGAAGVASFILVGAILFVALRSVRLVLSTLLTLMVGLILTAGVTTVVDLGGDLEQLEGAQRAHAASAQRIEATVTQLRVDQANFVGAVGARVRILETHHD
ncbi:MAG: ferrochelatase [Planctomycetes bacterium]|nr:ferrochelatase [Planctomycetota bacterium]